ALAHLGHVYAEVRDADRAIPVLERLLEGNPTDSQGLEDLGKAWAVKAIRQKRSPPTSAPSSSSRRSTISITAFSASIRKRETLPGPTSTSPPSRWARPRNSGLTRAPWSS